MRIPKTKEGQPYKPPCIASDCGGQDVRGSAPRNRGEVACLSNCIGRESLWQIRVQCLLHSRPIMLALKVTSLLPPKKNIRKVGLFVVELQRQALSVCGVFEHSGHCAPHAWMAASAAGFLRIIQTHATTEACASGVVYGFLCLFPRHRLLWASPVASKQSKVGLAQQLLISGNCLASLYNFNPLRSCNGLQMLCWKLRKSVM